MADQAQTPQTPATGNPATGTPDAAASLPVAPAATAAVVEARVRRSPRYGVFLVLGAAVGVFVAMILTFSFHGTDEPAVNGALYSPGQVFGFLSLIGVAAGLLVGGLVAIVLDRVVGRRQRTVTLDREVVDLPE